MDLLTATIWWCHLPVMHLALGSKEIELELELPHQKIVRYVTL